MSTERLDCRTADGVTLRLVRQRPAGPRRGVALLVHAMMAHGGYLGLSSRALASAGIDTFTLDLRGHGASVPPSPRRDRWTFDAYVREDVPAAVAAVAAAAGVAPGSIAYLGHSLGGMAGVAAFGTGAAPMPARLVLVAATPWSGAGLLRMGVTSALAALATPLGYLPVRALRAGTNDENVSYLEDFSRWVRAGDWPYREASQRVTCPTLAVASARDPYCTPADARRFAERLAGPVTVRVVGTEGHFGFFRSGAAFLWPEVAAFMSS